jgi:chromatin segregation and condensation protein Rec8/ScpA/Scc1 (kleisin family)
MVHSRGHRQRKWDFNFQTDILLEAANFQKRQGWFETDMARSAAASKSEFDFWTVASQFEGAKNVFPLAQKLLTCYSAMDDVERTHKHTSRHRDKYSNRKMDSTTQAYCEIAIAEGYKRRRKASKLKEISVMDAFRSLMRAVVRARKEQKAAAQAIEDARAEVTRDSDDDTAPPNGFDDILNEVCDEAGYESEESDNDSEAW